ncbi:hypothetical protein HYPSUDRAFT_643624 [Hypholoma sublateritium FD-334 SS-4]|uniref:Uncharacterized protein n=1 Tax=Hypholoma sublateritium (strain FD-334 SS-4) TaxID=945553 RepID=A0A0D2PS36_HYPSF|nr:hypothetical protein HYPSUDRAFT_643624 [Hypholoma sublateritium FD-334 SS-4]
MAVCPGKLCTVDPLFTRPCATCLGQSTCACNRLAVLEANIKDTEKTLASLERQRVPLKSELNQAHDTLLSRLPAEIVSLVFLFCTPTMVDACHTVPFNVMLSEPLILGAVCHRWRTIAWATPRLWSSISVNPISANLLKTTPLAEEWLERSRNLPLTINIYIPGRLRDIRFPMSTEILPMLDALARHSRRWRHISIELPHRYILYICDSPFVDRPVALESIHIHLTDVRPPESSPVLSLAAYHSPSVVALCHLDLQYLGIRWENLTYLRMLDGLSLATAFKLLECAPKLQYYELLICNHDLTAVDSPRNIVHHGLRCLNFQGAVTLELAGAFLGGISLPSLEEFNCDIHRLPLPAQVITSLISTSSRGLLRMSLGMDHTRDNRAISILESAPSLTQLTLKMFRTSWQCFDALGNFFQKLSSSKNVTETSAAGTPFLPHLQELCIDGPWPINWSIIVDIFPPAVTASLDGDDATFRPLHTFTSLVDQPNSLFDALSNSRSHAGVELAAPEVADIRQFLRLRDRGIAFNIVQRSTRFDDEYDLLSYLISKRSIGLDPSPPPPLN